MEVPSVFSTGITAEEWSTVPALVGKRLEQFVTEQLEQMITSKALLETARFDTENEREQFKAQHDELKKQNTDLEARLGAASGTIHELESQITNLTNDVVKFQTSSNKLEAEAAEFRHQRNLAVDEKEEHVRMLQRRNAEVERLQSDLVLITKQLEGAINAKCEALASADEVTSMKLRLEYREKRLDQERQLLNNQLETLSDDLNVKTEELLNMRRDNTSRCIQLETKLSEKTQELAVANDQIKSLNEINNNLISRHEELSQKILSLRENDAKTNESYLHEIEAKTKIANAYKSMHEENEKHIEGLKDALAEVQQLLKHATDQYGDLETKHKEAHLSHEEILTKKNECIAMLKQELERSKELLDNSRTEDYHKDIENLSPTVTSARLFKPGMTVTEMYSQYVTISEKLADIENENAQLKNYIKKIVREVEEKGPLIKELHEKYANALDANEVLQTTNDELVNEMQQLKESTAHRSKLEDAVSRENARYKKEVADLSRQVCHLLQEVENSRAGSSSTSTDMDLSDSVSSADIITKRLVTFNDIPELQKNNQKLLAIVRDLTERQEEAEAFDPATIAEFKMKIEQLREAQSELMEERERQTKMMVTLGNQRDMYKNLYAQAAKDGPEVEHGKQQQHEGGDASSDDKILDLTSKLQSFKEKVENLKVENEVYRKEKTDNEKILLEQLEKKTGENKELVALNCKLSSQLENNEEKFKISQSNLEIYKKQISGLEKQNKIYNESVIKHEHTITYLKDEVLQAHTKVAKSEVNIGNLEKQNALLKDAELRLINERDNLKRDTHAQSLLQTNIELIKATLERCDAENRLRAEARLDEANRECAALRRRLQEEQDRFRDLSEHLESQTATAKQRMNEEKAEAEKLRHELVLLREDLIAKSSQLEELSRKLKTQIIIPETNVDARRIAELERDLSDFKAEIEALKTKLKTTKEASEQYCNVALSAETQLKIALEQQQAVQDKVSAQAETIQQLQEKCSELEGELSIQLDDQDIANAGGTQRKSTQLQEELNVKTMDLRTAREQLESTRVEIKALNENLKAVENKYAREVVLHSADLQLLTDMKTEVEKLGGEFGELKRNRDCLADELAGSKLSWESQEQSFKKEKLELEQRFKDINAQNALLHDEIQALNNKLSIIQVQADNSAQNLDTSLNKSLVEDEIKSSEQLLKVIKYLRQEKDISISKAEILEAELERTKSQLELLSKQVADYRSQVEDDRQKSEVAVVTAAKHAEVLRKVETLNAITDSNRALRQERDTMKSQIEELRTRADTLAVELAPMQDKNRELAKKAEAMQTENISLRGECTRWRQRAQMLIEKSNRTSPEDWKKLQGERETLAKQLTIERGNVAKLNDEINTLRQDRAKLEEQVRAVRQQSTSQGEELARFKDNLSTLQTQMQEIQQQLEQSQEVNKQIIEENRVLTEDTAGKDVNITELKNNLTQIRKIAKKYKIQCEDQTKEIKTLKDEKQSEHATVERQLTEQRTQLEDRIGQMEQENRELNDRLSVQGSVKEETDTYKKEIETLKQGALEREERFKNLFKNAKERIVILTEQVSTLKGQLNTQDSTGTSSDTVEESSNVNNDLIVKIDSLEKEKANIIADKRQENEKYASEIETLMQKIAQLQRQLGQQLSKPSTSSGVLEKPATEPPTANIKPMAGHSTNTQTQSVPIHPWRSAGETPLASIRPMSMSTQLRTVTVLPTSQSPSAVMVPPQQQVHTTGSSTIEALSSSSPTSSHTDYVPATSSASSMLGPRQIAVPPTQSTQDNEDEEASQVQIAPQQQAVALVLPRVEPPAGPTQEQGTSSSSSSNTVTTTQAGHKRQRDSDTDQNDEQPGTQQQNKRSRVQPTGAVSDSGLEVEYQVPTSSQRDHDDDNVIVVESDEEGAADEGEGADDEPDDADTEGYDMEVMEQDNYEDADCQDVEDEEGGNEVEVIEDSSEVPNQSEGAEDRTIHQEENLEQAQPEATSSGTDGGPGGVTFSQASTSASMTMSYRTRPIAPLPSRQQQQSSSSSSHLLLAHGLEESGDDGIVPSTPTLFVPRRSDGFGEAVSSPHVPSGRFTFNESVPPNTAGSSEIVPEQTLEVTNMDENSTGRSVPSTPLQSSPQESIPTVDEQISNQTTQSDAEIPSILVSVADEDEPVPEASSEECMGPPNVAGTSTESAPDATPPEDLEGFDGVSSEGEKQPSTDEGEEEGREAEASPSTNTRSRSVRGAAGTARRSGRHLHSRGNRSGPTPIVWGDDNRPIPQLRHSDGGPRPSRAQQSNYSTRVARRPRGRPQRPYGRF